MLATSFCFVTQIWKALQKIYSCRITYLSGGCIPYSALYLSNVAFSHKEHAKSALSYTSSNGLWKFSFQQQTVEHELFPFLVAAKLKLFFKSFFRYPYSNRGDFKCRSQYRIVYEDISVQPFKSVGSWGRPVIIVG